MYPHPENGTCFGEINIITQVCSFTPLPSHPLLRLLTPCVRWRLRCACVCGVCVCVRACVRACAVCACAMMFSSQSCRKCCRSWAR
jgi:hypothetical protein